MTRQPHNAAPDIRHQIIRLLGVLFIVSGMFAASLGGIVAQESDDTAPIVYVIEIEGTIDLGLAPFLERILNEADDDSDVEAVILEINTPGGRLDAALQMRNSLLDAEVRTIAFIDGEAFSAGALIALASQEIYFQPGAVMGAATPVTGTGETADEKVISAVRSTFESTAEERGRDPQVAEAMVDPDVVIDGLSERGQLLTLTTSQAEEWGYADGVVSDRAALLDELGLSGATIEDKNPSLAERLVRFLTDPIIASLLFSIGTLLIIGDILVGGIGVVAAGGASMLGLFFWGHFLAGLAGWEGVVLAAIGVILIGVEIFVIPGFGVAGVLGAASLIAGFFLTLTGQEIQTDADLWRAAGAAGIVLVVLLVGTLILLMLLPQAGRFGRLSLQTRLSRDDDDGDDARDDGGVVTPIHHDRPIPAPAGRLLGATGQTLTDLRPGGIAVIDGERVDVVTEGEYVEQGVRVVVIRDEHYRRVVRAVDEPAS